MRIWRTGVKGLVLCLLLPAERILAQATIISICCHVQYAGCPGEGLRVYQYVTEAVNMFASLLPLSLSHAMADSGTLESCIPRRFSVHVL